MDQSPVQKQLRFQSPGVSPVRRAQTAPEEPDPSADRELCNSPTWEAWSQNNRRKRFSWFRRSSTSNGDQKPSDGAAEDKSKVQRPAKLKKNPPTAMSTQRASQRLFSLRRLSFDSTRRMSQSSLESTGSQAVSSANGTSESLGYQNKSDSAIGTRALASTRSPAAPDTGATNSRSSLQIEPQANGNGINGSTQSDIGAQGRHGRPREPPRTPSDQKPQVPRKSAKRMSTEHIPLDTEQFDALGDSEAQAKALAAVLKPSPLFFQPSPRSPGLRRSSEVRSRRDSRTDQSATSPQTPGMGSLELTVKTFLECCRCRRFFEAPPEFYLALECECRTVRDIRRVARDRGIEFKEQNIKWHFAIRSDGRLRIYCFWCHHSMRRSCCEAWHTSVGKMERQWHPLAEA